MQQILVDELLDFKPLLKLKVGKKIIEFCDQCLKDIDFHIGLLHQENIPNRADKFTMLAGKKSFLIALKESVSNVIVDASRTDLDIF